MNLGYYSTQKYTSSTSSGDMINGGDIIMLSPETRTNIPSFSHCAPKYAPTPRGHCNSSIINSEMLKMMKIK